ncbi:MULTISPECIES: gluconate 2-dehydrogenase subunit 3 family protein [Pseudomonas]|uniref:gluconate 2-dehydrogenase subunit 3 family protein n=1 Tax=Pseudomonas TaxID=286 RepID=UPI0007D09050|nr:gluconate 2-dehydrogenase subunit 3 family protein [Pseudomonas fluorescens]
MKTRYPGYDVMDKRSGPSWNEATRTVIEQRLAVPLLPRFFNDTQWRTLLAFCACVLPQPADRPAIPVAAMVDHKLHNAIREGYIDTRLPPAPEAWCQGLVAIDEEAMSCHGVAFHELSCEQQHALIIAVEQGTVTSPRWDHLPSQLLFRSRLMHDLVVAYYSHPSAWSEIGFGGPASPRGYVRLGPDRRDPWEPAEAKEDQALQIVEVNRHVR